MQVQESSTNERIPATESLIPLELVRVEVPATGASINVIPSSNDQTIQDILYEACLKLSLVPSEHKCKITFKDKRVEYPSANQLFKDFKSVDFISLVSKDGPKREKTVLSKSIVKLEVRDSVESFPLALFSGVKAAVPKIGGSYVTQSSDSSGFKRTASMNAKTKAEGNSLAIDELGTLDRRRSVGDSALSPPSSAATTHDHAVSADAIQTPEITDREYFPIKFKAPAEIAN
ncbi:hypothetical protein BDR26DRAFT_155326 [Obelidium mucronatum]|nr:hypothetical protein BDR26DRAFT_155326 [Obelidium mucronatum]